MALQLFVRGRVAVDSRDLDTSFPKSDSSALWSRQPKYVAQGTRLSFYIEFINLTILISVPIKMIR